jgi:hypothetical protein
MAQGGLDAAIDRLYAVPPEAFVAERARLAKELKSDGEQSAAGQVAKLSKPTAAAWALNHVAREDPDAVAQWLDAAEALRDASTRPAEVGGDVLRTAMADHRAATARLLESVRDRAQPSGRPLSEAMVDRVRTLLHSATADAGLADRLRAGRVTEDKAPAEASFAPTPQKPSERPAAKPSRRTPKRDAEAAARAARRAELERRVRVAQQQMKRLRAEAARREAAAQTADERLDEARRALHRSESEATAAHDAAKDADQATAAAEHELEQLQSLLRDAG